MLYKHKSSVLLEATGAKGRAPALHEPGISWRGHTHMDEDKSHVGSGQQLLHFLPGIDEPFFHPEHLEFSSGTLLPHLSTLTYRCGYYSLCVVTG